MSTDLHRPAREVQALEEVGSTAISRRVAWCLATVFVLTIFGLPLLEPFAERFDSLQESEEAPASIQSQAFSDLGRQVLAALKSRRQESLLSVNRSVLAALHDFEDRLEEESFLRRWLLPRLQWRLAATIGLGNEQVYIGQQRWLFYRSDVDYVIGRGFLDPRVQAARRLGGDVWLEPPDPDPLPALLDLQQQLRKRQIRLIVMPTPVKPMVEPERLSGRAQGAVRAFQNPSFDELLRRLADAGILVVDPAPLLVETRLETGEDPFLRTDTHWTPSAVEVTARELAGRLGALLPDSVPEPGSLSRRPVVVEGLGDTAGMLSLSVGQPWMRPERVTAQMVLRKDGRIWRADRGAEILLLGDSFTNVYSDAALGWGAGAGLGEQLSYFLQQPVDKLAVNAGGALQTRQTLQRALASGDDRLAGKKVLIYQFAARELAQGNWRAVELSDSDSANR